MPPTCSNPRTLLSRRLPLLPVHLVKHCSVIFCTSSCVACWSISDRNCPLRGMGIGGWGFIRLEIGLGVAEGDSVKDGGSGLGAVGTGGLGSS